MYARPVDVEKSGLEREQVRGEPRGPRRLSRPGVVRHQANIIAEADNGAFVIERRDLRCVCRAQVQSGMRCSAMPLIPSRTASLRRSRRCQLLGPRLRGLNGGNSSRRVAAAKTVSIGRLIVWFIVKSAGIVSARDAPGARPRCL